MPTICGRGFYNHRPLLLLMDRILDGRPVAVAGDGSLPGDFVAVGDVVQAFLLAGERPQALREAFNVSARESASHLEIVQAMIEATGSPSRVLCIPAPLARAALWAGRLLRVHDLPACQDGYLFHPNRYSIEKARRLLGYSPALSAAAAAAVLIEGYREDRDAVRRRSRGY
ncbi:MAG: hypothetical protein HY720_03115 [Planctomycetes bacterium]|nr:hypothetical protein [Planctomycetota bacterium]